MQKAAPLPPSRPPSRPPSLTARRASRYTICPRRSTPSSQPFLARRFPRTSALCEAHTRRAVAEPRESGGVAAAAASTPRISSTLGKREGCDNGGGGGGGS